MNATEQRNHKTALDEQARLTAETFEAVAERCDSLDRKVFSLRDDIGSERTSRLALANEQRSYVDARDRELRECCQERWIQTGHSTKALWDAHAELRERGFWSRLNWLLTGR